MRNAAFYAFCVLAWGSTYFAVTFLKGPVPPGLSVVYRLALVAVAFWCIHLMTGRRLLGLSRRTHGWLVLFGLGNFGLSYAMLYAAVTMIPSAHAITLFATKAVVTPLLLGWFLRESVPRAIWVAGGIGLAGVTLMFWPQLAGGTLGGQAWQGFLLTLGGAIVTSGGDVASTRLIRAGGDPMTLTFWGTSYGLLFLVAVGLVQGQALVWDPSLEYALAMVWLVVACSIVAWLMYMHLVKVIGPARCSNMVTLFPVVGVALSLMFEGVAPTLNVLGGAALVTGGAFLANRRQAPVGGENPTPEQDADRGRV